MTRNTLEIESCVPTMKIFRFVKGKVAIACGASGVCHGFCEDSNVKKHFVEVVAALLNVSSCFR